MMRFFSFSVIAFSLVSGSVWAETQPTQPRYFTLKNFTVDAQAEQPANVKDPFEPINRKIFSFNSTLDRYIAKPIAIQYQQKIPEDVRGSYRAFRKNFAEPWNAVNQLAQGKPTRAVKTLGRFSINTLTSLGFADPASRIGLESQEESFGSTLGYYGVPSGAYLMLPIIGPSTIRDSVGIAVDWQANAKNYILQDDKVADWAMTGITAIDRRTNLLSLEQGLPEDQYAAIRDMYLQVKKFEIAEKQGKSMDDAFIEDVPIEDEPTEDSTDSMMEESSNEETP